MKRFLVIGLLGLALVVAGTIWAWVQFAHEAAPPAPSVASAPPTAPAPKPAPPGGMPAPPISAPNLPSFDVVRVNPAGDAVMAGRAEPHSIIIIMDGDREVGRAQADARGEWVFVPNRPLPPGARELSLMAKDPDGATLKSEQVVVLAVPEPRRDPTGAALPESTEQEVSQPGEPRQSLAVATPREGAGPSRVLQFPTARPSAGADADGPIRLALDVIDYGEEGRIVLSGRAPPGSSILVYLDNKLFGRTITDANGTWTLSPESAVAPGIYKIRVDQLGPDGRRVIARIELPFQRSQPGRQLAADEAQVVVQPGNSLWRIARRSYGEGMRYTLIYEANRDQIRDPDLIYPGQLFVVPKSN